MCVIHIWGYIPLGLSASLSALKNAKQPSQHLWWRVFTTTNKNGKKRYGYTSLEDGF